MAWSAYLIEVRTGQIGPQLDVEDLSWDISLNSTETLRASVIKSSLPENLDLSVWLSPWRSGILVRWNDFVVFAGPIISRPSEGFRTISFDCGGIRSLLMRRYVVREVDSSTKLAKSVISYTNMSLGTIAKKVVAVGQNKNGGGLPIRYAVADESGTNDADHQRTYRGFNVSNLSVDDVLTKLSNVSRGPDIMFRPRLVDDSKVVWDLWTGTEDDPRILQEDEYVWDTTSVAGSVTDLVIVSTGSYMTNRVYSTGAGQDEGLLMTISEAPSLVQAGYPLLETVISTSQSENTSVVQAHGSGNLQANLDMLREITLTVRIDGVYPLGTYQVGNEIDFYLKGWLTLKDGRYGCRLLHMSGGLDGNIRLSLQTERYHGSS